MFFSQILYQTLMGVCAGRDCIRPLINSQQYNTICMCTPWKSFLSSAPLETHFSVSWSCNSRQAASESTAIENYWSSRLEEEPSHAERVTKESACAQVLQGDSKTKGLSQDFRFIVACGSIGRPKGWKYHAEITSFIVQVWFYRDVPGRLFTSSTI